VLWGRIDNRVSHLEVEMDRRPTSAEVTAIREDISDIKRALERLEARLTNSPPGEGR
jgi:ubiquinone biosynthesis protein UbiJ